MDKIGLACKFGTLTRADGSVLFSEGESTVVAGIFGPVEVKIQKLHIEKASVECNFRPKAGLPGVKDRFHESSIRNLCETALAVSLYPRSSVKVNIQELQNRGQLISCAINAACLACLDSGINMKFMFGAVTCFLNNEGELHFVAPFNTDDIKATFVIVFDNIYGRVLTSHTQGCFTKEQFEEAVDICKSKSENIFSFFKKSLTK